MFCKKEFQKYEREQDTKKQDLIRIETYIYQIKTYIIIISYIQCLFQQGCILSFNFAILTAPCPHLIIRKQ